MKREAARGAIASPADEVLKWPRRRRWNLLGRRAPAAAPRCGMTLAFLQTGDQLRTDCLCSDGICVEAMTPLRIETKSMEPSPNGYDSVNEWTLQLLRIRHLGQAEQRLHALLSLLVNRLGKRYGEWCNLPFRLTHDRIGELIGSTRVTSTRLISKLRNGEMLVTNSGEASMKLSPRLIESSPLGF